MGELNRTTLLPDWEVTKSTYHRTIPRTIFFLGLCVQAAEIGAPTTIDLLYDTT